MLRTIADGSEEAFTALYTAYIDALYGLSMLYLKQPQLAEDAVQSVFLKVWEHRHELVELDSFTSWLFIIARNQVLAILRKQSSEKNYRTYIKERMGNELNNAETLYTDQQFIEPDTFNILQRAISQLPPQQQTAFRLQREEGLSYEQIAERMGVAINTVRKHLHLALTAIREYAKKHIDEQQLILISCILFAG